MPDNSCVPGPFDFSVVDRLACPACLGKLRPEESDLLCAACGHAYAIVDGIPVLIPPGPEDAGVPG